MTQPPGVGEPGVTGADTSSSAGPPAPDNPFQAPPPGQPPYPPQLPTDQPPTDQPPTAPAPRGTNGLAIASLVLALVGLGLIGLVLGIVALNQIPKRNQQGKPLAWAGIVLSVLGMIAGVVVFVAVLNYVQNFTEPQRDESGKVTATADARIVDLKEGDCVTGLSESADAEPKVVPCDGTYEAEVFAAFDLPAGEYPGAEKLKADADSRCTKIFEQSGAGTDQQSNIWYIYPSTELAWKLGQRSITCLTAPSGP